MKNNTCIVCEYGWIIIGIKHKGIGGIAKEANKSEYTLDEIGDVSIYKSKVLFEIPCEW